MNNSPNYIDWNRLPDYNYVLQYIQESEWARREYQVYLYRVALAMEGRPWKNLYREQLESNLGHVKDPSKREKLKNKCLCVPEGQDFSIAKAVNNRANQMSTGVDTYNYQIFDPYMIINDETEDLLAAQCEQDYVENKLGNFASVFSRDLTTAGVTAVRVDYDPVDDKNKVVRINPKNILWDTKYSSTGQERFRGYKTMMSWSKLKEMIANNPYEQVNLNIEAPLNSVVKSDKRKKLSVFVDEQAKYSRGKIESLNGLDVYVDDLNRIAQAPNFAGFQDSHFEFAHDLRSCYNLNMYQSFANDPEARTLGGYEGDDVELTVVFDMIKKIEFKVINRRFVISANGASFRRFINFAVENPLDGSMIPNLKEFKLDSPLKFQFEQQNTMDAAPYPISPVMRLLDIHDELCALRAKRKHVSDVLSILRVTANSGDAESVSETLNIMGVVLDDVQGDVGSVNFVYDYTHIDSQISYYEQTIKEYLAGYSEFDAMQMMGDRASAAESGMAIGAMAQGLATHQNALMQQYSDIARQCIANRVAYSSSDVFPITNNGNYSAVTLQQMALSAVIDVKPKMAKQIYGKTTAANALQILGTFKNTLPPEGQAYFMEEAMFGTAPRKMLRSFVGNQQPDPAAVQAAQLEGQNTADILAQNQQMYENNPMPYETDNVMQSNTSEDIDAIIGQLGQEGEAPMNPLESGETDGISMEVLDMVQQDGSRTTDLEGLTYESGSELANMNAVM